MRFTVAEQDGAGDGGGGGFCDAGVDVRGACGCAFGLGDGETGMRLYGVHDKTAANRSRWFVCCNCCLLLLLLLSPQRARGHGGDETG